MQRWSLQPRAAGLSCPQKVICGTDPCYVLLMLIKAYGLFWRADEVDWNPGTGNRNQFRLLGRIGWTGGRIIAADFRRQRGLYILYNDYGPYYVGLNRLRDLGTRLKEHQHDLHAGKWDRFSWFGFCSVLEARDETGLQVNRLITDYAIGSPTQEIADMEALLIKALGTPVNLKKMRFRSAKEWVQVRSDQVETVMGRLRPGRGRQPRRGAAVPRRPARRRVG